MKKILYFLLSATTVLCGSCSDFLDRDPYSSIPMSNAYKTEKDMNLATIGLYGTLQTFYMTNYPEYSELASDNTYTSNGENDQLGQFDRFSLNSMNSPLSSAWDNAYHSIMQCNLVLEKLPPVEFSDPEKKEQIEGEALFIRALSYFNLVRMFGKVPLVKKVLTQSEARQVKRDEVDLVYECITTDLNKASNLLPPSYMGKDIGRATRYAALTLLGKVYLTIHKYDLALEPLNTVITEGNYELLTNFEDIFNPSNANHKESIFEIQYEGGNLGEGSRWSFKAHPRQIAGAMGISATDATLPTKSIIDAFDKTSKRYAASVGSMTYNGVTRNHVKKHYMEHTVQNSSDDNWPLLRLADVYLMYAEAYNETTTVPDPAAVEFVNKIRRRAYGLKIDGSEDKSKDLQPIQYATRDAFRQAIWDERRIELAFEGHRWFDLVRTGQYVTVMNEHVASEFNGNFTVQPFHSLYPVPQVEIDINPLLKPNNEGYN